MRGASPVPLAPRWAVRMARLVPMLALPSALWRLALGVGIPVGFHGDLARLFHAPGWITVYVILLGIVTEALALLTLGLVMPWGEAIPARIPIVGGRRVPVPAAVIPGMLGAIAVLVFAVTSAVAWNGPQNNGDPDAPHGLAGLVMDVCYAPLIAWGPLLGAVTIAYAYRRLR